MSIEYKLTLCDDEFGPICILQRYRSTANMQLLVAQLARLAIAFRVAFHHKEVDSSAQSSRMTL